MELLNISPIDGRYNKQTNELHNYFSEYSFIKYRLIIEIEYFITLGLHNLFNLDLDFIAKLRDIYEDFDVDECKKVKIIEDIVNHDVKAIEYYIKDQIAIHYGENNKISNFVHFGLTSQDVNCTANILMIKDSIKDVFIPKMYSIKSKLTELSNEWMSITFLSKTHGQPATPSTIGKELMVFVERITNQIYNLNMIRYKTKFGGAVGNFNAHYYAYPDMKWDSICDDFLKLFYLQRNRYTTQIDHYDNYAEIFDIIRRFNTICIDLCQDIWLYISRNILIQKINTSEVGSSTMPFKINPINFENAEGNFLLANSLLEFFSRKLPVSRMQRDLTDSTVLRNVGTAFGYSLIGYTSLLKGLNKININQDVITKELLDNYVVISEGIQTRLKKLGISNSYEKMKEITRNYSDSKTIQKQLNSFIDELDICENEKEYLRNITPFNYVGIFK